MNFIRPEVNISYLYTVLYTDCSLLVSVYHMYGVTEMSVWQVMTRLETEEEIQQMPIFVAGHNLLSDTQIHCTGGQIDISSNNRQCWIVDQDKSKNLDRNYFLILFLEMQISSEVNTGDIGSWSEDKTMLFWKGRKDDVVKIFGRSRNDLFSL